MRSSILALVVVLLPAVAGGQKLSKDKIERAKAHYKSGVAAEQAARWDEAVKEFTAAYDITKDPKVFYQIAHAHEQAGHDDDAIAFYKRYLEEAKLSASAQAETKVKIDELEKKKAAPAPGTSEAGGEAGGGDLMAPGEGGESRPPATPEEPEAEGGGPSGYRTAAWVAVGLTAAALTTAGVLATSASAREEDLDRLVDHRDTTTGLPYSYQGGTVDQYQEAVDEGEKLERYSIVAFVGAGVFAAAAVTFFVIDAMHDPDDEDAEESASAVQLVPTASPSGAGVTATWSF